MRQVSESDRIDMARFKIIEPKQEDNFIPGLIIGGIVGACL